MRPCWKRCLTAPLLCVLPLIANADDGELAKLVSECSAPDLPQSTLDSCLERVRVREETDSSAQLRVLEANLERRASRPADVGTPARLPPSDPVDVTSRPATVAQPAGEQSASVAENREQDSSSPPPAGADVEDEPPIADPPDSATGDAYPSDQSDAPQY